MNEEARDYGTSMNLQLHTRLRWLRKDRGWTLRVLQEKLHERREKLWSISYLSEVERDMDTSPSLEILYDLADVYEMSVVGLLVGTQYARVRGHADEDTKEFDEALAWASGSTATLRTCIERFQENLAVLREVELRRRAQSAAWLDDVLSGG